jgi:hypothetical protein
MPLAIKSIANPAAGAEAIVTVTAGKFWVVRAIHLKLVTEATAGSRLVRLAIDDGTNVVYLSANDVAHAASLTSEYSYAVGAGFETAQPATSATAIARVYAIPDLALPGGYRIRTVTALLKPLDQFSEINLLVEETTMDPTFVPRVGGN